MYARPDQPPTRLLVGGQCRPSIDDVAFVSKGKHRLTNQRATLANINACTTDLTNNDFASLACRNSSPRSAATLEYLTQTHL
eukprot:scaffold180611_cov35-Tisochrysis_lutea.AAC.2